MTCITVLNNFCKIIGVSFVHANLARVEVIGQAKERLTSAEKGANLVGHIYFHFLWVNLINIDRWKHEWIINIITQPVTIQHLISSFRKTCISLWLFSINQLAVSIAFLRASSISCSRCFFLRILKALRINFYLGNSCTFRGLLTIS